MFLYYYFNYFEGFSMCTCIHQSCDLLMLDTRTLRDFVTLHNSPLPRHGDDNNNKGQAVTITGRAVATTGQTVTPGHMS
jgi:hypothetical protein